MKTNRSKNALMNTIAGFADEIVVLICGLILPRLILVTFGSTYNGVVSSITQFISCISLMKAGIGGVTKVALYKPLAENNYEEISAVVVQTEKFMRRIAAIFVGFVLLFAAIYPIWICTDFEWWFSFSLIIIISLSTFAQYYFGLTYQMVLHAAQKQRITVLVNMAMTIMNTIISVILIKIGCGIHMVKLGSAVVHVIGPVFLNRYTRKKYHINKSTVSTNVDLLQQRWDAVAHEVAQFVNTNTDVMVLTMFASIMEVSVYTVYNTVVHGIRKLVMNFVTSFGAAFGDMYARGEYELMKNNLRIYELIVFSLVSIIYSVMGVMITGFAMLYTSGVTDVNYFRPGFAMVVTLAGAFSCYRIPYETVVKSAGHYKQTRNGAIVEAVLNITISIALVIRYGLIGVAIGTLIAAIFRTLQFALYLSQKLIKHSIMEFIKHLTLSMVIIGVTYVSSRLYIGSIDSVSQWIIKATITTLVAGFLTVFTDFLFYHKVTILFFKKMFGALKIHHA